jgi:hypothetical protein
MREAKEQAIHGKQAIYNSYMLPIDFMIDHRVFIK